MILYVDERGETWPKYMSALYVGMVGCLWWPLPPAEVESSRSRNVRCIGRHAEDAFYVRRRKTCSDLGILCIYVSEGVRARRTRPVSLLGVL